MNCSNMHNASCTIWLRHVGGIVDPKSGLQHSDICKNADMGSEEPHVLSPTMQACPAPSTPLAYSPFFLASPFSSSSHPTP